jgi:hypothetical protein
MTSFASQIGETGTGYLNQGLTITRDAIGSGIASLNRRFGWNLPTPRHETPVDVARNLRTTLSPEQRRRLATFLISRTNAAAASLFNQLYAGHTQSQWIIAHSQGNLVTADALWALSIAYGDNILSNMQVFSLASPTPAWPAGIDYRRKVYGHTNDLVTLCDPHNWTWLSSNILDGRFGRVAGDWRQHGTSATPGIEPHDMRLNVFQLNFVNRLRRDLGLSEYPTSPSPPRPNPPR